ncbi:condensation domain-containing protein [Streptomyces sp. B6B3]|uniref:condensation domain-containing protein n=1 Tax=Streptomyces sp. B6B3 TaxID=3153570 RepID=UPI00325DF0B4
MATDAELPLAPSQETLWEFMTALTPHDPSAARLLVVDCRMIHGRLDPATFRAALDDVTRRHEALRMVFTRLGPEPAVRIRHRAAAPLRLVDLTGRPPHEQDVGIDRLVFRERTRTFDLLAGPLWHANLVRLAPERHLLTLSFFHLVSDGWSCRVLVEDLLAAYGARLAGRPVEAPPAPTFREISAMQRERIADRPDRLAYWRRELRLPERYLRFPARTPDPDTDLTAETYHPFTLRAETADGVRQRAWRLRTTPYILLMAAFHILLALRTGAERVTVGTTTSGRETVASRRAVCQFTNNVYVPATVRPTDPLADVVRAVHAATVGATEHVSSFLSLARAVYPGLAADRPWPDNHLFDAWLQSAAADRDPLEAAGLRVEQPFVEGGPDPDAAPVLRAADVPAAQLPTWIKKGSPIVVIDDDRRGGGLICNRCLFPTEQVAGLVTDLLSTVEAIVRDPGTRVAALPAAAPGR